MKDKIAWLLDAEEVMLIFEALDDLADSAIGGKDGLENGDQGAQDDYVDKVRSLQFDLKELLGCPLGTPLYEWPAPSELSRVQCHSLVPGEEPGEPNPGDRQVDYIVVEMEKEHPGSVDRVVGPFDSLREAEDYAKKKFGFPKPDEYPAYFIGRLVRP
jgi:hypothetical protein